MFIADPIARPFHETSLAAIHGYLEGGQFENDDPNYFREIVSPAKEWYLVYQAYRFFYVNQEPKKAVIPLAARSSKIFNNTQAYALEAAIRLLPKCGKQHLAIKALEHPLVDAYQDPYYKKWFSIQKELFNELQMIEQ